VQNIPQDAPWVAISIHANSRSADEPPHIENGLSKNGTSGSSYRTSLESYSPKYRFFSFSAPALGPEPMNEREKFIEEVFAERQGNNRLQGLPGLRLTNFHTDHSSTR
jgi:hypothetical protein